MTGIELYSTTAASNNSAVPNGFPEGMAPSGVNDAARQMMAAIRTWYETAEWINFGHTPTYIGATQFSVTTDRTATYQVGRRIRAVGTTPFTIYGTISASAYASVTTVTVVWDSGSLNGTLSAVSLSINSITNKSLTPTMLSGVTGTTTGTGSLVLSASPTFTGSPILSTAQATSISFSTTAGIVGTTTNDSAAAGSVGQYLETIVASGSAVSLVNATGKNMASLSLTAGDWDVEIVFQFTGGATTVVQAIGGTLSASTNTLDVTNGKGGYQSYAGGTPFSAANPTSFVVQRVRVSIASTTTYYAVAYSQFSVDTCSVYGMINARRVR